MSVTRRAALRTAALAAGAAAFLNARPIRAAEPVRFVSDPFKLGVASGDPTADGFVLWTRLAPNPFEPDGGLGEQAIEVKWTLAADDKFKTVLRSGTEVAHAGRGHAVHVELTGLMPDRPYWYRFEAGGVRSPTGRAKTLPTVGVATASFKLGWTSCQHFEQGFFNAYKDMVAWNPDLILHLGDYIYESSFGQQIRRHPNLDPRTLADYRVHHAVYKLDEFLQAAHAHTCWALIWDDHDVANDYAGLTPPNPADNDSFAARRAAAYQAWFENQPIARRSLIANGQMRIYQQLIVGDLLQMVLLDTRQFRTPRACVDPARWRTTVKACPGAAAPDRTVLGSDQEFWLGTTLDRSPARWTAIVQPSMLSHVFQKTSDGQPGAYQDGWSHYPAARQAILDRIARRGKAGHGHPGRRHAQLHRLRRARRVRQARQPGDRSGVHPRLGHHPELQLRPLHQALRRARQRAHQVLRRPRARLGRRRGLPRPLERRFPQRVLDLDARPGVRDPEPLGGGTRQGRRAAGLTRAAA